MSPRRNWDSPTPSLASECTVPLPPESKGGGAHSPAGEGVGESQFRRLKKKLNTLPTLCTCVLCKCLKNPGLFYPDIIVGPCIRIQEAKVPPRKEKKSKIFRFGELDRVLSPYF